MSHTNLICATEGCADFLDFYSVSFTNCLVCQRPLKAVTQDEYEILRTKWWRRITGAISSIPETVVEMLHRKREVDWPHFCNGSTECHDSDFEHDKEVEKRL